MCEAIERAFGRLPVKALKSGSQDWLFERGNQKSQNGWQQWVIVGMLHTAEDWDIVT
ncbi:hypothetical protein [Bacillus sp. FJAT-27445]|uniref:hypothetical protein n=1 Tax=Bacillus sp. FJAT-27445 TaxID=1679166 RepID=UPI000B20479C|nr:hypothetical protein [Bacillus sp. FJAT-27445]